MKKLYFIFVMALMVFSAQAQITGTVTEGDSGEPLIGASVMIKGTTFGTITDVNGSFSIENSRGGDCQLEISYLGYQTILINVAEGTTDAGTISLKPGFAGMEEVVITGVMDIVRDRRTPVAVSTITTAEIQAKAGNVEFPELMKNTPSIYVAGQAGGYGDSEVFTRGFDQTNTAFLLNGQPINGMEDGKMYWSNWSGMTDVATAVQVQRGLGSSKLAISSVGGTTNIIMKATELEKGGSVGFLYGNDNYMKGTVSYNTGMINDKFGISFLATHWQGDGWAEGTKGQGQNYFLSAGYKASEKSTINFLITGAPQYHDQNFSKRINEHFDENGEFNIKYNDNWGTYSDGTYKTIRRNYYHKPVANLNWDYKINDRSSFSAVAYASWGRGGGTGGRGNFGNLTYSDRQVDWTATEAANLAQTEGNGFILRASANNHSWYGGVLNYENQLSDNLTISVGSDLRSYRGTHFRQVVDLLGNTGFEQNPSARHPNGRTVTATFEANPWSALSNYAALEERIHYANDETIRYGGVYGQVEYTNEKLSAFVQGAVSNQSHVRIELRNELPENENSEKVTNGGYNVKTGLSYSFDDHNTFYANTGVYSRQPFHDNIYLNFSNFVNPVTVNENIFGLEAGYKYSGNDFTANVNVYRTSWKDRATTRTLNPGDELPNGTILDDEGFRNSIQNQLHSGIELDFGYRVSNEFKFKGYASIGDWTYDGTLDTKYYNQDRDLVDEVSGDDVTGVKVGGAAQTTFGFGADYRLPMGLKFDADYNYYSKLHSNLSVGTTSFELPSFGLLDLGVSYNFDMGGRLMTLRANVFNALGTEYISRARDGIEASTVESENWNGVNQENEVLFGKTRTWNVSVKYNF